ncbi:d-alanyl-d-alanine carboxypeptidase [hydrocarbon metagenome]|uniref:serine-type D-Ala-D-Ala carboxypeptidase n=1 Tax=hydrocarbon metagenome TaxID=938273 RepID=A0A0W8E4Q1_9ZZZZ
MKPTWFRITAAAVLILFLAGFQVQEVHAGPYLTSKYVCLLDGDTGQLIYGHNSDEIRPVASTTKMMTAILAVEYADLEETVVISKNCDRTPEYTIGLLEGQESTVGELLKAALIKSANDAAVALAEHVAGNERFFSCLMSKKAFAIGAVNTHFVNASGLPSQEHVSTAYDLAVMGRYLLSQDYINELVAARHIEFKHPGYQQPLTITNTNGLLNSYNGANGIKTGTTNAAGKCLVASAKRDNWQLIAVALNSPDRNGDCTRLLNYGYQEVSQETVIDSSLPFKQIKITHGDQDYLDVYPEKDLILWQGTEEKNLEIEKKVEMEYSLTAPISKNQAVGVLHVYVDGKLFASTKLISHEDIAKKNRWISYLKEIFDY